MMIFVWIALALFFLYALFSKETSDALLLGSFFLWVCLAFYFLKSWRRWKKEDELRRKERQNGVKTINELRQEIDET